MAVVASGQGRDTAVSGAYYGSLMGHLKGRAVVDRVLLFCWNVFGIMEHTAFFHRL